MSTVPMLPPRFADPTGEPSKPVPAQGRWDGFLAEIATGVAVPDAMLKCFIKRADIERIVRSNKLEKQRYREAKIAGIRSRYSEFDLEEFFDRVAMGKTVNEAFTEVFGVQVSPQFYKILREDMDLDERYRDALQTKATLEMEKAIDIIDDDSNDTLPGPKGGEIPNMAAVQRSRLKFEGRSKLAGTWYRRLYGEQHKGAEVTVNVNLAERLERGIQNLRDRKVTPRQMDEAIDASFTAQPAKEQDTSWMDEKPTDTMWLEEK